VAHALDVAAVAVQLPMAVYLDIPPETLEFLVALHDIGKVSRPFQGKVPALWPAELGAFSPTPAGPRHDDLGFALLAGPLAPLIAPVLPSDVASARPWRQAHRNALLRALAGHHGRPPGDTGSFPLPTAVFCSACQAAAEAFIAAMLALFEPTPLPRPANDRDVMRLAWRLAGITTLADWIGSRQAWFPYADAAEIIDLHAYLARARIRAKAAIRAAGLSAAAPSPIGGLDGLFPGITSATPMQRWAEVVELPPGPTLAIVEDLTGSGKTEAALILAHRLMAAGRADGVFVALPTTATANAMFARLEKSYRALFAADAAPSLALAHGRASLQARFAAAILPEDVPPTPAGAEPGDEPAEAQCAAWLADDRRRALLAQIGVGTIDQALLAALPVRHAALRLAGLFRKVLVIDEAHAFDAYMRSELLALLRFHAGLGGSAILLSATLPRDLRQRLSDAFRDGVDAAPLALECVAYPMATLVSAGGITEQASEVGPGGARRVAVTRLDSADEAADRIAAGASTGAAVAWIRNTVDDAIAGAALLRARGLVPLLFHARFALVDRLSIEAEILRRFGRDGTDRAAVLVATQVVEQSLDLDFDLLCSDLAPADLLIQRAGRLWRHKRCSRPLTAPEFLIISPDPEAKIDEAWARRVVPGAQAVYRDPALLWRSAREIFARGAIATPQDMRPLIEAADDASAEGAVPDALAAASGRAAGQRTAQAGIGAGNALSIWDGYNAGTGLWAPDLHTPTRLEDRPHVTLRLAQLRDGIVVPYAVDEDPRRAWALSEVSIAAHRVAACQPPASLEAAVAAARAGWSRWEREAENLLCAVLLRSIDNTSLFEVFDKEGKNVRMAYCSTFGLRLAGSQ
jgi:CRISPR-associated endonuclease/helicase Cas3